MVVDLWVNLFSEAQASQWVGQRENAGIPGLLGSEMNSATDANALVAMMDELGVDASVLSGGIKPSHIEHAFAAADQHPGRLHVAAVVERPDRPAENMRRVRELAQHPAFRLLRVTPLTSQVPLNAAVFYPVYAACEELGVPVSINVGIPGPRVRSGCQHPALLEDLLIDFPDLVIIGAHMGHPYESLLMQYMLKWPNLYLSSTAYLARYLDPALVEFMGSRRGFGRVLFGSDHPFLPMRRALEAARAVPLSEEAKEAWLGGTAARLLSRGGDS